MTYVIPFVKYVLVFTPNMSTTGQIATETLKKQRYETKTLRLQFRVIHTT